MGNSKFQIVSFYSQHLDLNHNRFFFIRVFDNSLCPKIEIGFNEEKLIHRIVTVEALSDTGPQMGLKTFRATRIIFILVGFLYIHAMSKIHVRWKK